MSDDEEPYKREFFQAVEIAVGEVGVREDGPSQYEMAEWLRQAADYVEMHTREESVDNLFGLDE